MITIILTYTAVGIVAGILAGLLESGAVWSSSLCSSIVQAAGGLV